MCPERPPTFSNVGLEGEDPGLTASQSGGASGFGSQRWRNLLIVLCSRRNTVPTVGNTGKLFAGTACDVGAEERTQGWPLFVWRRLGHRIRDKDTMASKACMTALVESS